MASTYAIYERLNITGAREAGFPPISLELERLLATVGDDVVAKMLRFLDPFLLDSTETISGRAIHQLLGYGRYDDFTRTMFKGRNGIHPEVPVGHYHVIEMESSGGRPGQDHLWTPRGFRIAAARSTGLLGSVVCVWATGVIEAFAHLANTHKDEAVAALHVTLTVAEARAREAEARAALLSATLEKTDEWYERTAELLDSANERLAIYEGDNEHPQRIVSLRPGTSPNTRCMETDYGRELARKVFHDAAVLLWRRHEGFEHLCDPTYWNSLIKDHMNVDPDQAVYRSHINVYTALCKAAFTFHGVPKVTHLTYNQLYAVLRVFARMGVCLVQKAELELVFGDQLDKYAQTTLDKFMA